MFSLYSDNWVADDTVALLYEITAINKYLIKTVMSTCYKMFIVTTIFTFDCRTILYFIFKSLLRFKVGNQIGPKQLAKGALTLALGDPA